MIARSRTDGPRLHRLARAYTAAGWRGSGTVWQYVQRVQPLPPSAAFTVDGHSFNLDLAGDIVDAPLYRGEYETAEQQVAAGLLAPGSVFVDVGANRGLYTALALAAGATVTAIEPHPTLAAELRRAFPGVCVEQVAVSDSPGTATLHVFPNSTYMSTIRDTGVDGSEPIEVPVARLDEIVADLDHVDLLKVDVEHLEASVLAGASELFTRRVVRAALVEVLVDHDRIAAMLDEWGYGSRLITWTGGVRRRPQLAPVAVSSATPGNYLIEPVSITGRS